MTTKKYAEVAWKKRDGPYIMIELGLAVNRFLFIILN